MIRNLLLYVMITLPFLPGCLKQSKAPSGIISGTVLENSTNSDYGVEISLFPAGVKTTTDINGTYNFRGVSQGRYYAVAQNGSLGAMVGPFDVDNSSETVVPELNLKPSGSIKIASSVETTFTLAPLNLSKKNIAGSQVEFDNLPPGTHILYLNAEGYVRRGVYVTVKPQQVTSPGEMIMLSSTSNAGRAWAEMRNGDFEIAISILDRLNITESDISHSGPSTGADNAWAPLLKSLSHIRKNRSYAAADALSTSRLTGGENDYLLAGLSLATGYDSLMTRMHDRKDKADFIEGADKAKWGFMIECSIPADRSNLLAAMALYQFIMSDDSDWIETLDDARAAGLDDQFFDSINRLKW